MSSGSSDSSLRERPLALLLLLVLLGGTFAAIAGRGLPAPLPADAPATAFSAGRARRLLDEIARAPHPVGSEEHARVLARLVDELRTVGLEPELQRGTFAGRAGDVELVNVLARVPGTAPTGTVLCLAHYDSVPTGPGAGDDGVGVVAWVEALRALRARGWQPRNDVLLLLSDGEELGLLGARLFAREHAAMATVRTVVNLEAIGNGGPAVLFELGPENGPRVAAFARAVAQPSGTSLGDAVYSRMPNDTDLTVFLRSGIGGFNLALTSGSQAYHAPHDTPENLDPRSLQHMGESALALAEHLGELDLAMLDGPSATFFDLLGRVLVRYPRALDPLPMGLGLVLVGLAARRARRAQTGLGSVAGALVRHGLVAAGSGALVALAWWLADAAAGALTAPPAWIPGNTTSGALLFCALTLLACAVTMRAADEAEERAAARTLAALVAWSGAAALALFLLPGASFAFAWPLVLAAASLLAWQDRGRRPRVAAIVLVVGLALALVLGLPILHLLLQLFLRAPPMALFLVGLVLASAAALFTPALRTVGRAHPRSTHLLLALGVAALLLGVAGARALAWRSGALLP
jgi:uncharacterized membrane protein